MVSQWHYLDTLKVLMNAPRVNIRLKNFLINVITILAWNPFTTYHSIPLRNKLATSLLIHTILPYNHLWSNLATNTLNVSSLLTTILPTALPTHNTLTYSLVQLHTSNLIINPATKCLYSLHMPTTLQTNILPIIRFLHWVNQPFNILTTANLQPSNPPSFLLPFNLPTHIPTKLPSTKTL